MPRLAILEGYSSDYGRYRKGSKPRYRLTKKRRAVANKLARAARKCKGLTKGRFKTCLRRALKGRKNPRRK
jgi:hypothetical protein